jgi:hypothetical protein
MTGDRKGGAGESRVAHDAAGEPGGWLEISPAEQAAYALLQTEASELLEMLRLVRNAISEALCAADPDLHPEKLPRHVAVTLLRSLFRDWRSFEILISLGYIGAATSVATSLWEKALLMTFMLCDPFPRATEYVNHDRVKVLPWSIGQMAKDIARHGDLMPGMTELIREDFLHNQYMTLCSIKHPNPQTVANLGTPFIEIGSRFLDPDLNEKTVGNATMILSIVQLVSTMALRQFASKLCNPQFQAVTNELAGKIQSLCSRFEPRARTMPLLGVKPASGEIREEFWDYLRGGEWEQDRNRGPSGAQ